MRKEDAGTPELGLRLRMLGVIGLLALLYALLYAVLWFAGVPWWIVVILAIPPLVLPLFLADKVITGISGAKIVTAEEQPELHEMVHRLSAFSGIRPPRIAVLQSKAPNAYAFGDGIHSATICCTTGILALLDKQELQAVVAHELSHLKNRDAIFLTYASIVPMIAIGLQRLFSAFAKADFDVSGNGLSGFIFGILFWLLFKLLMLFGWLIAKLLWAVSYLVLGAALSRYRELAADRGGALMIGAPTQLAAALLKISNSPEAIPTADLRNAGVMNAFYIMPIDGEQDFLFDPPKTHPDLEERLDQLRRIQQQIESN